jgi:hypothetical protein
MLRLGLVLLFAASAGTAAAESAQNMLVVQAFKESCGDLSSKELVIQTTLAGGWEEVPTDSASDLAAFLKMNRDRQDAASTHQAFANPNFPGVYTIAGVTSDGATELVECHAVSFTSTDWPDDAFFAELPGRLANADIFKTVDLGDFKWKPGLFEGQQETTVTFLPASSTYRGRVPSFGLMIVGRSYARSLQPPIQIQTQR